MSLHSLPLFMRLAGRPVILLGEGEAAAAKRRLFERAGAAIVDEEAEAALAVVAIEDENEALAAVARLKARGLLVNAVDRVDQCDWTIPAIVDRNPVIVAIGTGGVSAGLAAAIRQRLETVLPQSIGTLAHALNRARALLRARLPDGGDRRRAIAAALAPGAALDPLCDYADGDVVALVGETVRPPRLMRIALRSPDPDDLTVRQARALAQADRVIHDPDVPAAILDRARADAERVLAPGEPGAGLTAVVTMARV